jgi:hypothetical protein
VVWERALAWKKGMVWVTAETCFFPPVQKRPQAGLQIPFYPGYQKKLNQPDSLKKWKMKASQLLD